jgi:hypothetical protein
MMMPCRWLIESPQKGGGFREWPCPWGRVVALQAERVWERMSSSVVMNVQARQLRKRFWVQGRGICLLEERHSRVGGRIDGKEGGF